MRRAVHRSSLGAFWAIALASSCETKVDEPEAVRAPPPPKAAVASASGAASASSAASPDRCLVPLEPSPTRPIVHGESFDPKCPADPGRLTMDTATVRFAPPGGTPRALKVEVARTEDHRQRGLMYRRALVEDEGMIFHFGEGEKKRHAFWMHNTCVPLDMLFLDDDGTIVGIQENTPTMSDDTFQVRCASRYVLEVKAGWARRNGVKPGDKAELVGVVK